MYITTVERNMALNRKLGMPHTTQTPSGGIKRDWSALFEYGRHCSHLEKNIIAFFHE